MIGLCTILDPGLDPALVDPIKYFVRAYEHYSKGGGRLNRMLATRAVLFAAAHQQALGRFISASTLLMHAHFEVRGLMGVNGCWVGSGL